LLLAPSLGLLKIVPDDFVATERLALSALATFLRQLLSERLSEHFQPQLRGLIFCNQYSVFPDGAGSLSQNRQRSLAISRHIVLAHS